MSVKQIDAAINAMNTRVLLHFEHKHDITIIIKLHIATSPLQKFDNDCDVILMFQI